MAERTEEAVITVEAAGRLRSWLRRFGVDDAQRLLDELIDRGLVRVRCSCGARAREYDERW